MKEARKEPLIKSFWFNLLVILGLCVVLYFVFFTSLGWLTNHGDETKVPKVTGLSVGKAETLLKQQGFEVRVDSTYEPDKQPMVVLRQLPDVGEMVKSGRILVLIVNMAEPPKTPMPSLTNLSYRSALLIIKSNRLILADTIMVPFPFKYVMKQMIGEEEIRPGTLIPQGSKITLVIGDGEGDKEMNIPTELIGMPLIEALDMLNASGLLPIPIQTDAVMLDSSLSIVYKMSPAPYDANGAPIRIREGMSIDIYHKQNPTEEELSKGRSVPTADLTDPDLTDVPTGTAPAPTAKPKTVPIKAAEKKNPDINR